MIPHICPVCCGSGSPGITPAARYLHPTAPLCWPCSGTGVVWENTVFQHEFTTPNAEDAKKEADRGEA